MTHMIVEVATCIVLQKIYIIWEDSFDMKWMEEAEEEELSRETNIGLLREWQEMKDELIVIR